MRAEALIQSQMLIAQSIFAMAEHIANSTGFQVTPVTYAELPNPPEVGMIACITDSNTQNFGSIISPAAELEVLPAPYTVLAWYNGTNWTVIGQ